MTSIVNLIQNITSQINLLALNATIESGVRRRERPRLRGVRRRGQRLKNLANQAAEAAEQITTEINAVQTISGNVVSALEAIRRSVDVMCGNVAATAAAIEEQTAVTRDMSRNVQGAARDVHTISDNIAAITAAVKQVSAAVATACDAAKVLAR